MSKKVIVEMKNLGKVYSNGTVGLKQISLTIEEGEFIVIIGPSGAGKSTLLRSLNLLIHPTAGEVWFEDRNIMQLKAKELRGVRGKMGMIFQNYNLISRVSVIENVLHGALNRMSVLQGIFGRYKEEDIAEAYQLLQELGMEEKAQMRADELSGGQQQRVGICRALAQNPSLILADEPIASLDPKSSEIVMNSLKTSCYKRGISCIVNLHQVEIAKEYATRIIGMRRGEIVFDGAPEALTDDMLECIYHVETDREKKKEKASVKKLYGRVGIEKTQSA